ncbi:MAG: hypothetical protein PVJ98_06870 [Akkermansiaceae bacterium]|jgi:hypothetical protein
MSSIETSIHPLLLLLGAGLSIAYCLFLLRRQTHDLPPASRWSLFSLRSLLCLLIWVLIAQPKAVLTREESLPVSANFGVDVSQSMTLADLSGPNTAVWLSSGDDLPLNEALTLTEAGRIRLNLFVRDLDTESEDFQAQLDTIAGILGKVESRLQDLQDDPGFSRLIKAPIKTLEQSTALVTDTDRENAVTDLTEAGRLLSQTALGIRRILNTREATASDSAELARIDLVRKWMNNSQPYLKELEDKYNLRLKTFANDLVDQAISDPIEIDGGKNPETNLYQSLNNLSRRDHTKGKQFSMLVTDGFDSSEEGINLSPDVLNQPLIVFPVGDALSGPDSRIKSVVNPSRVRENDDLVFAVQVSSVNSIAEASTLTLRKDDEVIDNQEVLLKGDGTVERIELKWTARSAGQHEFEIELDPIAGDALPKNNIRKLDCTVIKNQYTVMVCDTFPRWETRYLQNLFNRDPSIKMDSKVFQPNHAYPGKPEKKPTALPFDIDSWKAYDLIILGDLTPTYLTPEHQQLVTDYVNQGGNLIILAGKNGMPSKFVEGPMAPLIPMTRVAADTIQGTFTVHPPKNSPVQQMVLLDKGNTNQIWQQIFNATPQYTLTPWLKAKQSARTILQATDRTSGDTYDFCATQRFGSGKIAYFAAPCLYHLRFRYGDKYHAKLWGQLIRGMCVDSYGFSDSLVATRLDRLIWTSGEEIQGKVRIRDEEGRPFEDEDFTAVLKKDDTVVASMKPVPDGNRGGDYFVRFSNIPPGDYQLVYTGDNLDSIIAADEVANPEQEPVILTVDGQANIKELEPPTSPSQFWGQVNRLPLAATIAPGTLPLMIEALDLQPEVIKRTSKRPLWDSWWILLIILAVSSIEWYLKRLSGLS